MHSGCVTRWMYTEQSTLYSARCVFMCTSTSFSQGRTPLMYACVRGQERLVRMLIEHGADPEVLDKVHSLLQLIYMHVCMLFHPTIQERWWLSSLSWNSEKQSYSWVPLEQVQTTTHFSGLGITGMYIHVLLYGIPMTSLLFLYTTCLPTTVQWVLSPFNCMQVCSRHFSWTPFRPWCQSRWSF